MRRKLRKYLIEYLQDLLKDLPEDRSTSTKKQCRAVRLGFERFQAELKMLIARTKP